MNFKRTAPMIAMCLLAIACGISMTRAGARTVTAAPAGNITWVKFTDPLEQAFTLEVPQGWTVKGGMFRLGYSDHREMVDMTSPDGKINIRLGDLSIPPYFLPHQLHHEGEVY